MSDQNDTGSDEAEPWDGLLSEDTSIRMSALNFAIMHGSPKDFTYSEVVECALAFEKFLRGA